MDKNTLTTYGWIVIGVIVIVSILAILSPYSDFIESLLFSSIDALVEKSELSSFTITTTNDSLGRGKVEVIKETNEDDILIIRLNVKPSAGFIYDGATVSLVSNKNDEDTETITLDKNTYFFEAPSSDVVINVSYASLENSILVKDANMLGDTINGPIYISIYKNGTALLDGPGVVMAEDITKINTEDLAKIESLYVSDSINYIEDNAFLSASNLDTVFISSQKDNVISESSFPQVEKNNIFYL